MITQKRFFCTLKATQMKLLYCVDLNLYKLPVLSILYVYLCIVPFDCPLIEIKANCAV